MSRRYDWDKEGRPRIALFCRVMAWVTACAAGASWPLCFVLLRDWTLFFIPPLLTAGAVLERLSLRKIYGAEPDYSAIARMEREVYGEAFKHEGSPETGGFTLPEGWEHIPLKAYVTGMSADEGAKAAGDHIASLSTCPRGHKGVIWVDGTGRLCPKCDG